MTCVCLVRDREESNRIEILREGTLVSVPSKLTVEQSTHMPIYLSILRDSFAGVLDLLIPTAMGMTSCHREGDTSPARRAWVEIQMFILPDSSLPGFWVPKCLGKACFIPLPSAPVTPGKWWGLHESR